MPEGNNYQINIHGDTVFVTARLKNYCFKILIVIVIVIKKIKL